VSRREFWKLLAEFLQHGITILVSTPYLDEAERCHRIALLHEGKLLALDTPDHLRAQLPGQMVELIVGDQARAVPIITAMPHVLDVHVFGERVHARVQGGAAGDPWPSWRAT
jgi:ABC-2 type transport system ATP-binding protein